jgi:hypothetical protein
MDKALWTLVTILLVIGGIALLAVFGMWLMHLTMTGQMMAGMRWCGVSVGSWVIGLLVFVAATGIGLVIIRRKSEL